MRPEALVPQLPSISSTSDVLQQSILFIRKCRQCTRYIAPQSVGSPDYQLQQAKLSCLLDLANYAASDRAAVFGLPSAYPELITFVSGNIFRPQGRPTYESQGGIFDPEEDEQVPDPAWPLLRPVYEVLLRWVLAPDLVVHSARKVFSHAFLGRFIALFDSEDSRERDYCKSILHRVYGRIPTLRAFVRTRIYDELVTYAQETQRHNGISDYLELLGPIINGFNVPVKDEHIQMLLHVLMPLHAAPHLIMYYRTLNACVTQFIAKDTELAAPVLNCLLRAWPQTSAAKAACFLDELACILRIMPLSLLTPALARRVARVLALSCASPHFQVSVRALRSLEQDQILQLLLTQRQVVYEVLVPALAATASGHWSDTVVQANTSIIRLLHDSDPALFDGVLGSIGERRRQEILQRQALQTRYDELRQTAYGVADGDEKKLRVLCRIDSYIQPALPSDVHGLLLFGKPVVSGLALTDDALQRVSMKSFVDTASLSQTHLIGFQGCPVRNPGETDVPVRYDTPLLSPLDKVLSGVSNTSEEDDVAETVLRQQGYLLETKQGPTPIAPTLACRGRPTRSHYQISAHIVARAADKGLVPLSAAVDTSVLAENMETLGQVVGPTAVRSMSAPPDSARLRRRSVRPPTGLDLVPPVPSAGALTAEQAAAVVGKLQITVASRVSTKRSFSVHPSVPPVDTQALPFDIDAPDSFSDSSSS